MDYEKAYTAALLRAKQAIKDCGHNEGRKRMIEDIFPELAESEDEKIRKQLLNWFKYCHWDSIYDGTLKQVDIIAWLEKQGERNNIVEQLTAFAQHLNKRGAFREDLCMDFDHEAQSFIEMQNNKEL